MMDVRDDWTLKCSGHYLGKFGDISDALLHLGEEGGHLLELLQLEERVAGGVLVQDEVWGHDGGSC